MKFFLPIALLAAAVAAQTTGTPRCDAENIVETCLQSENAKVSFPNTHTHNRGPPFSASLQNHVSSKD